MSLGNLFSWNNLVAEKIKNISDWMIGEKKIFYLDRQILYQNDFRPLSNNKIYLLECIMPSDAFFHKKKANLWWLTGYLSEFNQSNLK